MTSEEIILKKYNVETLKDIAISGDKVSELMIEFAKLYAKEALEYGLDYGYNQGFANASEDDPEYKELDYQEVFNEWLNENKII